MYMWPCVHMLAEARQINVQRARGWREEEEEAHASYFNIYWLKKKSAQSAGGEGEKTTTTMSTVQGVFNVVVFCRCHGL